LLWLVVQETQKEQSTNPRGCVPEYLTIPIHQSNDQGSHVLVFTFVSGLSFDFCQGCKQLVLGTGLGEGR